MRWVFALGIFLSFVRPAFGFDPACRILAASLDPRLAVGEEDPALRSLGSLSIVEGPMVNLWSVGGADPKEDTYRLQLDPNNPVIIGRQENGRPPYLAEGYRPSTILPQGGTVIGRGEADLLLSRAHFMLKASPLGIVLVNGVPGHGGTIRAPKNAVEILRPLGRALNPGESFLIEAGTNARVRLPNGTVLLLNAE